MEAMMWWMMQRPRVLPVIQEVSEAGEVRAILRRVEEI